MSAANLDSAGRPNLPDIDEAAGELDGLIDLGNAPLGGSSWKLTGTLENHRVGGREVAAGDLDGDGRDEVVLANPTWDRPGDRYSYYGIHMGVSNAVSGMGLPLYGPPAH